jgi:hypothetical protein
MSDLIGLDRVLDDIKRKRQRQVVVHRWTRAHDDTHTEGELGRGAITFIQAAYMTELGLNREELPVFWPFDWVEGEGKPNIDQPRRELLVNAAALLVAELERLDRIP